MGIFDKKKDDKADFQHKKLLCPRCGIVMKKLEHPTGAILDICDKCGGMWLDKEEVIVLYHATVDDKKDIRKKSNKDKEKTRKKTG